MNIGKKNSTDGPNIEQNMGCFATLKKSHCVQILQFNKEHFKRDKETQTLEI